ncbi:hypothetical protein AB0I60_05325 [Actinosynnema sp. NPDC050436]|uniref:NucA/NucB deoxyribonuclease domain-containing protein n=1 Tax=Actinosynnema sp. NPDC050436 TaxID=3155659 RepID=UPI0033FBD97A
MTGVGVTSEAAALTDAGSVTNLTSLPMNAQVEPLSIGTPVRPDIHGRSTPSTRPERRNHTPAELAEIARPGKTTVSAHHVRTQSGSSVDTLAEFSPIDDPVQPAECKNFYENAPSPPPDQWFKNRFNACHGSIIQVRQIDRRTGLAIAGIQFKSVFLVSMAKNARSAQLTLDMSEWYDVAGNFPGSQRVTFSVGCWDPNPAGPECNPDTVSFSDTVDDWRADSNRTVTVDFAGTSAPLPNDPVPTEKRSFYQLSPYYYLETGIPRRNDFVPYPDFHLRCDIARTAVNPQYVRGSDCVFHEASGIFQLSLSDTTTTESVQFLKDAFDNITSTKPGTPGTFVPGKYGTAHPLSRLYYDGPAREANRAKSIATCVAAYGQNYTVRPDGRTNDCDEFPFATTHQGSYTATGNRSYAVRPLLSAHNAKVGSLLSNFVAADHILEEDTYHVLIN